MQSLGLAVELLDYSLGIMPHVGEVVTLISQFVNSFGELQAV